MDFSPTSQQVLFLWRLLFVEGGSAFVKNIKPDLQANKKKELSEKGLIEIEKRPSPGKRKGARADHAILTDKGWEWIGDHLNAAIGSPSKAGGPIVYRSTAPGHILHKVMVRLQAHLQAKGMSLAEFMSSEVTSQGERIDTLPGPTSPSTPLPEKDGSAQLRQAYLQLTQGRLGVRVRLADLRSLLPDWPRKELDELLTQMESQGQLVLYPLDDPREIGPADELAAVRNSVGDPLHIMYMEA